MISWVCRVDCVRCAVCVDVCVCAWQTASPSTHTPKVSLTHIQHGHGVWPCTRVRCRGVASHQVNVYTALRRGKRLATLFRVVEPKPGSELPHHPTHHAHTLSHSYTHTHTHPRTRTQDPHAIGQRRDGAALLRTEQRMFSDGPTGVTPTLCPPHPPPTHPATW
jgi:hypothetical protein